MEALAPPLHLEDPDSSIPSLFPYDSFPMPKGLYAQSNSSRSSTGEFISGTESEGKWEENVASIKGKGKGKAIHGVKRPGKGADELLGLAPALPISPPRSTSSTSSPRSSPTRSRRAKSTAELRQLAKNQRARNFTVDEDLSSQRASRSTLASFTSTGESVYEDAVEPDSDHVEELLPDLDQSRRLAPLDTSLLPDAPPEMSTNENGSRSRQITPRPTHQSDYGYPTFASPTPLSPETVASLDERILYEQRQVDLQAEAKRRMSFQQTVSTLPISPRAPPSSFRRHSGVPRNTATPSYSHARHASLALATSPPIAGSRQWHPKPLVLTPARTMSTPLTNDSNLLSSPNRHLSTQEGSLDGHLRSHSRGSSYNDGTIRTASPLSPGGHSFVSRSTSPCQSSPRRQSSIGGGNPKRRSLGYVASPNEPLSSFGRRSIQYDSRGRSSSEDTRVTGTTTQTGITRFTVEGESPESSLGGWSEDMKMGQASPSLDDKEWEQQWQANRVTGTPLEMVEEVSSSDIRSSVITEEREVVDVEDQLRNRPRRDSQLKSFRLSQQISSNAPILRRRAATDDRSSLESTSSRLNSLADTSLATLRPSSSVSGLRRGSVPPTPPPKLPLPRPPPPQSNKRSRSGYDQHWNGEPLTLERDSSSSTFGDEDSDYPASPKKSSFSQVNALNHSASPQPPLTSSPRRPIVIKGATRQSAAASARRSERLSQNDPPRYRSTSNSDRSSSHSSGMCESRPSSRSSRRTSGLASWEGSYDPRNSEPLSTLPESESPNPESYPQPFHSITTRSQYRSERPASRTSYASPRISIGSTFANGFGATRKVDFEPRDPRTLEELDAGQGSYLEVLLYSEPPPRAKPVDVRKSTATSSSYASSNKRASLAPLVRSDSPTSPVLGSKPKSSSNFAQKLFSGFRAKPSLTEKTTSKETKRPISIAGQGSTRSTKPKPRPVVSGPLELQTAELAQKQLRESAGVAQETVTPSLSVSFAPPVPIMKSYTSLSRAYEQESDLQEFLNHSDSRTSLETIDRTAPRAFSLPPGLVSSKHDRAPPPPPPVKPPRSPLRPAMNSGNELLQPSPRADSPVLSFKSFNSHRSSIETSSRGRSSSMGRNSSSEPIGVRDVMRGQFLER